MPSPFTTIYNDFLTLHARPLTDADYAANGGTMTTQRCGRGPVVQSFVVGDFFCRRQMGTTTDTWIEANSSFALSGWFPVSPPDTQGFCVYRGPNVVEVTNLDNGMWQSSFGCIVTDAVFRTSYVQTS